jgi:trk system potassium uptake protein TrkA
MYIIILGAGRTGQDALIRLQEDGHTILLVDKEREHLNEVGQRLSVKTRCGSATDISLLEELMQNPPDLVLALTDSDTVNLFASACVKQLGNPRTIVKIKEIDHYSKKIDIGRLFHVDHFIFSEMLVAEEIVNKIVSAGRYSKSFFHGNVLASTQTVAENSPLKEKSVAAVRAMQSGMIIGLIYRPREVIAEVLAENSPRHLQLIGSRDELIFPHGNDVLMPEDEVLLVGPIESVLDAEGFLGIAAPIPKSALLVGGTKITIYVARLLHEKGAKICILDSSHERCLEYAELVPFATVHEFDEENLQFLQREQVAQFDLFVACAANEESNMHFCLIAHELGSPKVVAVLSDEVSYQIARKEGISCVVRPSIVATDRIVSLVLQDKLLSIDSLYGGKAEIIEAKISNDSPIAGIPISELKSILPPEVVIGAIYTRGRILIAAGNHILSPRDEVIIISQPRHRTLLQKLL